MTVSLLGSPISSVDGFQEILATGDNSVPVFFAQQDGPSLVAYSIGGEPEGDRYLKDYISAHASYAYEEYRNLSLWLLLDPVLRHPNQAWVRDRLRDIAMTAVTGSNPRFREGLPLTVAALQVVGGDKEALNTLEQHVQTTLDEVNELEPSRGKSDSWGNYRRRLAVLAEAYAQLLSRADDASDLLEKALQLPFGLAGFTAPANLTLAEAIQICLPSDRHDGIGRALNATLTSAHNVQDATFCARSTARCNAMCERWWKEFDIQGTVERLCQDASTPEFSSLHRVGEQYGQREIGPHKLPLPPVMLNANTIEVLARVYQRSLEEFQRLNPSWKKGDPLPPSTAVAVPDPGFPPLLAARLAAVILADPSLANEKRIELLQLLVPIAVPNPTALDTVLYRFLLAARSTDAIETVSVLCKRYLTRSV